MDLNIVKYLAIIWMYVNNISEFESCMNLNPIWIWIMYEFESYMNLNLKYSYNLYLSNSVGWLKLADTKDLSLVLAGLS
jgi:hypothetical protein